LIERTCKKDKRNIAEQFKTTRKKTVHVLFKMEGRKNYWSPIFKSTGNCGLNISEGSHVYHKEQSSENNI